MSSHPLVQEACEDARAYAFEQSAQALAALELLPEGRPRELLRNLAVVLTRRKT